MSAPTNALAAALLAAAGWGLLVESGSFAFDAAGLGNRSAAAEVVPAGAAYHAVGTVAIHASTTDGYDAQAGVTIRNDGAAPTTFTWTLEADADGVVNSSAQCAAPTAVGGSCTVRFSGPAKPTGSYSFAGRAEGSGPDMRSRLADIVVNVTYCASPPCP